MISTIVVCEFADKSTKEGLFIFESFIGTVTRLPFAPRVGMKIDLEGFRTPEIDDYDGEINLPTCVINDIVFINDEEVEIWCNTIPSPNI